MSQRFTPCSQPRLAPDRAYTERSRDNGKMAGVTFLRRTCSRCGYSKPVRGGTTNPKFICAECL